MVAKIYISDSTCYVRYDIARYRKTKLLRAAPPEGSERNRGVGAYLLPGSCPMSQR